MLFPPRAAAALSLVFSAVALASDRAFDFREITLDNGLRVITLEDFSCPVVAVHLWYHVGSKDEDPERQGFAHMFEHMMFRGTDRLGPTDHFDLIRAAGGDCNAYTSFDHTTYVQTLPANQLELALWLEAERMGFLNIDQHSFDTERKVVEEERRLGLNRPFGTLPEKILPELLKSHPYRWTPIGRIPHLRAATVQELRSFWTRYYVPNNATLVIVGAVRHADAQAAAGKYLGWIPRCPDPPRVTQREPPQTEARRLTFKEDHAPVPVCGVVFRTVPARDDDYVPLQMLAMILGGGQSSRLYRELVAEKQLAVMAMAAAFSLEDDGAIAAGAALSPLGGDTEKVLALIDAQLERLRSEPVGDEELTKVRNQMLSRRITSTLTVASKAQTLGGAAVVEGGAGRANAELDAIRRVTPEVIARVARTYLAPERATTITVERNLLGSLFGRGKSAEDDAPITATPEVEAPPPGRPGLRRPAAYPEHPPVAGLLDYDPTPAFTAATLPNGLRVVVIPNHEVPYVSIQLGLLAGAWSDAKPGTASMALSMLTRGTRSRSEGQLAAELEMHAIALGGSAGLDTASVSASCMPEHVERAMTLLGDVVLNPAFPEPEFEKLRTQTRATLAISAAEASYVADRELRRRLFGEHPYARTATGEPGDLDRLDATDLTSWWATYARPDMAVLYLAGDIEHDRAVALATQALGAWTATGAAPSPALAPPPQPAPTRIYLVDRAGVQSQIRVGALSLPLGDPRHFTARVVSGYFGGGFNSRLNDTIRVKKGLTYGARGGYAATRFAGQFSVSTFSKTSTTAQAVAAILDELERLQREPPTDKELGDTKSYLIGSFPGDRETPQQVLGSLWYTQSHGLPADHFARQLKAVAGATAPDCVALARETIDPAHLAIVVVGSADEVRASLEKLAPVEIVTPAPAPAADDD